MTYTLADIQAIKSEIDAKKYAPGGVLGPKWTVHVGGKDWEPLGYMSEDAITYAEPEPIPEVVKCHCGRDWHTAPLRKRVADMVRSHYFDPNYKAAEDESPIVCVGSETLGPNRPQAEYASGGVIGIKPNAPWVKWVDDTITYTYQTTLSSIWTTLMGGLEPEWPALNMSTWFAPEEPMPCEHTDLELDVQLGPEHWPIEPVKSKFSERHKAGKAAGAIPVNEWREPLPLPASLALDVSALADEFNKKHNPPKYPTKGINA